MKVECRNQPKDERNFRNATSETSQYNPKISY